MEQKKSPKADLTRKTGLFLNIGLVVSLALVIGAFEMRNYEENDLVDLGSIDESFEEMLEIPPTEQPPPPPPKIQQPEIIVVEDEEEIEEEVEVEFDVEITDDTEIEEMVAAEEPAEEVVEEIFTIVEDPAEPNGGMQAFYKYVGSKLKYPSQAKRMGVEGKVFVEFVVDKDGTLTNVRAVRGIGAGCDEEAVRVIKNAAKWKPGKQRGRAVKVKIVLPISFKLQ